MKNLILIVMDALRFDHVNPEITPNLMEIAGEGVFFKYCLAGGGTTKSSIPCIISANYQYDPELNLPTVLKKAGYTTGCLHSNLMLNDFKNGFDTFLDLKKKHLLSKKTKRKLRRIIGDKGFGILKAIRRRTISAESYIPYERAENLVERCLRWIEKTKEPYFLWVHFMEPHIPYFPPENNLGLSTYDLIKLNDKLVEAAYRKSELSEEEVKLIRKLYRLEISYMDHWIGRFYREIKNEGIIVFTSDHGDELGDHGGFSHGGRVLPELYHVPLIIVGDGIKRGVVVEEDVSHLDLAPTLLDLLGLYEYRFGLGRSFKHLCAE